MNQTLGQELPPDTETDVCARIFDTVTFLNPHVFESDAHLHLLATQGDVDLVVHSELYHTAESEKDDLILAGTRCDQLNTENHILYAQLIDALVLLLFS